MGETREPAGGPFYDELVVGQRFEAPSVTLTDGQSAVHQALVGDRLLLPLSVALCERVLGPGSAMAHPALVWDLAIGQSTRATQRVKANLRYRGLRFLRVARIGDTLTTVTEVAGMRDNRPRAGREPTGLVLLRMRTHDQDGRPVLVVDRCAMLPMSAGVNPPGHDDDVLGDDSRSLDPLAAEVAGWSVDDLPRTATPRVGKWIEVDGGDRVVSGTLLTRLSLNLAATHAVSADTALVYGGQVIGTAFAQVCRALPGIVTVTGWQGCDHLGPVREGDVLTTAFRVEAERTTYGPLRVLRLTVHTSASRPAQDAPQHVLDWRLDVLVR